MTSESMDEVDAPPSVFSPEAGLLTHRSLRSGSLPIPFGTVALVAGPLAVHSGATVRDLHPLSFSLAVTGEHLELSYG